LSEPRGELPTAVSSGGWRALTAISNCGRNPTVVSNDGSWLFPAMLNSTIYFVKLNKNIKNRYYLFNVRVWEHFLRKC
jgi:hypothetical protein